MLKQLPPDPEGKNDDREEWAAAALIDLLGDLMHWSDHNAFDFGSALKAARMHYEAETARENE